MADQVIFVDTLCNCDSENPVINKKTGVVECDSCKKFILCEFCEEDTLATVIHLDYVTCEKHERDAINNVANRRW